MARKRGLPETAAPALVAAHKAFRQERAGWVQAVRAEYGANFEQTVADALSVVARYHDPDRE
jgi:hypothetical protein